MMTRAHCPIRRSASLALLLNALLVALLPAADVLHAHGPLTASEWHTHGTHEHGDGSPAECPLLRAVTTPGITEDRRAPSLWTFVTRAGVVLSADAPPADGSASATFPRGPPAV